MTRPFASLTGADLRALVSAARAGRLSDPYTGVSVGRLLGSGQADETAAALQALGLAPDQLALALSLLAAEREAVESASRAVELVWTGPETAGSRSRDTSVVVRELFSQAESSVLVSGFVVYQGRDVFGPLARRMAERPGLKVRLFLNISRPPGSQDSTEVIVRRFVESFRTTNWPGERLPEIFYDPRSLDGVSPSRAVLHAKCIVIDDVRAFVTSANLTEAAQERNIEAGLLIADAVVARALRMQFETLAEGGVLKRAL